MRGSILVLFGFAAIVVMTILFSAQMRFDRQAELQIKGIEEPRTTASMTVTAAAGTSAEASEETQPLPAQETEPNTDPRLIGEGEAEDATASARLTPLTPAQIAGLIGVTPPLETSARTAPKATPAEGKSAVTIPIGKSESAFDASAADRRVDVVLTRQPADGVAVNDVVVQNARVLAVDRSADIEGGEHASTNAVTLEVDTEDAQKLILATKIGALSLIQRESGDRSVHEARPVSISDLIKDAPPPEQDDGRFTLVRINRPGAEPTVHRVPKER